jgi:hypothetical protein
MLEYVYIDESGDLGPQSQHLVITALIADNPAPIERIVKNMRRHKFRKELRKASEIRANNSSDEVRKYMLEKLNEIPAVKVVSTVLDKKKFIVNSSKQTKTSNTILLQEYLRRFYASVAS